MTHSKVDALCEPSPIQAKHGAQVHPLHRFSNATVTVRDAQVHPLHHKHSLLKPSVTAAAGEHDVTPLLASENILMERKADAEHDVIQGPLQLIVWKSIHARPAISVLVLKKLRHERPHDLSLIHI